MRVHRFASLTHYADHIDPIWQALDPDVQGSSWAARAGSSWGIAVGRPPAPIEDDLLLVASYTDARRCPGWPLVYVEHGAGQSYAGDVLSERMPGYAGGDDLDRVRLFVCPSIAVAAKWRRRYPAAAISVAGCPKLDALHEKVAGGPSGGGLQEQRGLLGRTVALTFHWDCQLVPETRGAWPFYDRALPALVSWAREHDVTLLGHGHPRLWGRLAPRWAQLGVEPVQSLSEIFERADVLCVDNSSAAYEFASLDRPVLSLNAPWYRRDVEHGLRFWSAVPGVQVDQPGDLVPMIEATLSNPRLGAPERHAAMPVAYAHRDGKAAHRAAAAIMEALSCPTPTPSDRRS